MTFGSGEIDPSQSPGGGAPVRVAPAPVSQVTFSRRELNRILDLYGRGNGERRIIIARISGTDDLVENVIASSILRYEKRDAFSFYPV